VNPTPGALKRLLSLLQNGDGIERMCLSMRVCVREREKERVKEKERERETFLFL
jgi:hypothetical protein